jgi:putative SOS response-associated peptidase YedK
VCGRVRLITDFSEIRIKLKFDPESPAPNYAPDCNIQPTGLMLTAVRSVDDKRVAKMTKWGLIPRWGKDDKMQYSTHNTRSEDFKSAHCWRFQALRSNAPPTMAPLKCYIFLPRKRSRRPRPARGANACFLL